MILYCRHCPCWVVGYTHWDAASYYSSAITFWLMFAVDSICLSTYSNVSCDCWAKTWRPNCALFSYNSNGVLSDKNPNSFNCKLVCRSRCLYCPSALVSVCLSLPQYTSTSQCLPSSVSTCLSVSLAAILLHTWAIWLRFMSGARLVICNLL